MDDKSIAVSFMIKLEIEIVSLEVLIDEPDKNAKNCWIFRRLVIPDPSVYCDAIKIFHGSADGGNDCWCTTWLVVRPLRLSHSLCMER